MEINSKMKRIVIIGAGGFGREIKTLIDQINKVKPTYHIEGFYDDNEKLPKKINGLPLLGNIQDLVQRNEVILIALGIGNPKVKQEIVEQLKGGNFAFPILIHPSAIIGEDDIKIGRGSVICAGNIITCNIKIGEFVTLNLACTIGHDSFLGSFSSFMPSINISGEVEINKGVYVGTGAKIINQLSIGKNSVIGAGAVVTKNIPDNCTAVGIPAKPIKFG